MSRTYSFGVQVTSNFVKDPNVTTLGPSGIFSDGNTTQNEVVNGTKVYLPRMIENNTSKELSAQIQKITNSGKMVI